MDRSKSTGLVARVCAAVTDQGALEPLANLIETSGHAQDAFHRRAWLALRILRLQQAAVAPTPSAAPCETAQADLAPAALSDPEENSAQETPKPAPRPQKPIKPKLSAVKIEDAALLLGAAFGSAPSESESESLNTSETDIG